MRERWRWGFRACLLAGFLLAGPPPRAVAQAVTQTGGDGACQPVESRRFTLHSDPWINLHHFLFQWARNDHEPKAGDRRRAVEVNERSDLASLGEDERRAWEGALDYYRSKLTDRDLLFDRDLIALRGRLAGAACSPDGLDEAAGLEDSLRRALEGAMPVYRERWWPRHHEANVAWIEDMAERLRAHEEHMASGLAKVYGGEWPEERVRVDATAYSNWAGGYTTNGPDHVVISSRAYLGTDGFELLFHEVSHAGFFEQRLLGELNRAFESHGSKPPRRLSHTVQFVAPAVLIRSILSERERSAWNPVGRQVAERAGFLEQYELVFAQLQQLLDGRAERAEAFARIAEGLSGESAPRN